MPDSDPHTVQWLEKGREKRKSLDSKSYRRQNVLYTMWKSHHRDRIQTLDSHYNDKNQSAQIRNSRPKLTPLCNTQFTSED